MLRLQNKPHNGGAKDGEFEMSLGMSRTMVGVERMAGGWVARPQSLAVADSVDGNPLCQRASHSDHLVEGRRSQRRLPRHTKHTWQPTDLQAM
jgi:hypothetical protein